MYPKDLLSVKIRAIVLISIFVIGFIIIKSKILKSERNFEKLEFSGIVRDVYRFDRGLTKFNIEGDTIRLYGKGRELDYAIEIGDSIVKNKMSRKVFIYKIKNGKFNLNKEIEF